MTDWQDFYKIALQSVSDGVYFCDSQRRILYWNAAAERITGFSADEARGHSCADGILTHVDAQGHPLCETNCPLSAALTDCLVQEAEVYLHHKDGYRVPVSVRVYPVCEEDGSVQGLVEVFTDNSPLLAALEMVAELSVEADTDVLTGVGNRRSMETAIDTGIAERRKSEGHIGVLFADIDHFKDINDTFGHETGDRVLKMVTETFRRNLRASDSIGRWGGDEFLAVLRSIDAEGIRLLAEKLRSLVASSYLTLADGTELRVTVSVGITLIRPSDTGESLLARADRLLYESKSQGRNQLTWQA